MEPVNNKSSDYPSCNTIREMQASSGAYIMFAIDDDRNAFRVQAANSLFQKLGAVAVVGRYKGQAETSWIMPRPNFDQHIRGTHWVVGQESFLHVPHEPRGACVLEYQDGRPVGILGPLVPVSWHVADYQDACTYDPVADEYWICGNPVSAAA